ncbi:hypothetical protein JTL48_27460 [Pseudomonas aeruginosa]|nr:hypothetical protein [Pseudomonas aeruginosa]MBN1002967.1 hypothetical protein [Pseudomonas aeruginosa]HBO6993348.1 hypothetical protein [Pseudomonas aeruginosa]
MHNAGNNTWAVTFFRTRNPIFPDVARATTAKLLDGMLAPEQVRPLMHYGETTASPGFSPIKFIGAKNGFGVLAYGTAARETLDELANMIAICWSAKLGVPVIQDSSSGYFEATALPYFVDLTIPRIVIQKKPRHQAAIQADMTGHISRLILSSISSQCEFAGLTPPPQLQIQPMHWEHSPPARLGHGGAALATLRNLQLRANIKLAGWWSLGYITGKGYGNLNCTAAAARALGKQETSADA